MRTWLIGLTAAAAMIAAAFLLSPWPSVWLIRQVFDRGAAAASTKLEKHVPPGTTLTTHRYDQADPDALLDIIRPPRPRAGSPVVVWIHGGGFVSGQRGDVTNYLKVLAGRGFTVINLDYTIAPEATYPTPVRQVQRAVQFVLRESPSLGVDPSRLVLAGDSAGAQIAAQVAATITDPNYGRRARLPIVVDPARIAGVLLFCGAFEVDEMGKGGGILGWFVGSTKWAYSGNREGNGLDSMTVVSNVSTEYPPTFISAGNADPLLPQSVALADSIQAHGVPVTSLFFDPGHTPPLGHEYQFDLDRPEGRLALDRAVDWLNSL